MEAYINAVGAFLPNEPVGNDQIEAVLGVVNGRPSRIKQMILKRNGINTRHYARNRQDRGQTHTNAQQTAEAVRALARNGDFPLGEIDVLACGTSSPDQMIPSHASMVHDQVGCPPCEIVSTTGVCCSGMAAMKYAYLSVLSGKARRAVSTGSELASSWLQASAFQVQRSTASPEDDPYVSFEQEFLRWMLSDGAGAVAIEPRPRPGCPCLRIDWLDIVSLASEMETCMYCGGVKEADGSLRTWRELDRFDNVWQDGYLNLTQDIKVLKERMVPVGFLKSFSQVRDKYGLSPDRIDWWLPHISSQFFRQPTYDTLVQMGFELPYEKWFTNLSEKGNTGSASIYIMLEELWSSGRLRPGQRVLCGVPESARFTFAYMHCTVV
jgi:3-oxoacyl-[acyl-carrier-protein] synthase III